MNARFLFVATTLTVTAALGSIAGCTVSTNDGTSDASPPKTSGSSSGTSSGTTSNDGGIEASTGDGGDCLASKERGPLCHADNTPEPAAKCADECDTASTAFSSDIALAISDCIDDAIGTQTPTPTLCEQTAAPCVALATANACENDTAAFCDGVLAKCSDDAGTGNVITRADCHQYFKGATTQGKQLLLDCLEAEKADPKVCKICMDAIKSVHKGG